MQRPTTTKFISKIDKGKSKILRTMSERVGLVNIRLIWDFDSFEDTLTFMKQISSPEVSRRLAKDYNGYTKPIIYSQNFGKSDARFLP